MTRLCEQGDKCGQNHACGIDPVTGRNMFCLGIPMNNVPVSAADDAGTCDVLNCTHDSKPCRGDSVAVIAVVIGR